MRGRLLVKWENMRERGRGSTGTGRTGGSSALATLLLDSFLRDKSIKPIDRNATSGWLLA